MLIRNESDRQEAHRLIDSWSLTKVMELIGHIYKPDRSKAQNSLSHKWYAERAKQTENGVDYERFHCKLTYGVPILLSSQLKKSQVFRDVWDSTLKHFEYEQRFQAMAVVSVTSLMSVSEFKEYLDIVNMESSIQGLVLSQPDEYKLAMGEK